MTPLRQAIRSLSRNPHFAATAIITIALSIAANTAVYAVVHAVLLAPLPFRQPQDLVQVWETHPSLHNLQVAVPDYLDWKGSVKSLDLAAYTFQAMDKTTLLGRGAPMAIQATNASPGLFDLLGMKLLAGRVYEERDGQQPLILISERLCRERFSPDPAKAVGQGIQLGAKSFTVVGVVSQRNSFPVWADVWMPFSLMDGELFGTRKYHPLEVIGRLVAGAPLARAESELEVSARQIAAANPATNGKIGAFAVPLLDTVVGEIRTGLLTAWIAVSLVLGIACANLAHLMMGHALSRRNEVAIRLALGAGRLSILRMFLFETGVLSLCGWLLGVLAAYLALPFIERLAQGQVPRLAGVALDWRVLLFGLGAAVLTAVIFAMPAYSSGNMHTYRAARRSLLSKVLMSSEVALSLAVLLAAVLLVRSFVLTVHSQPGFEPGGVMVVHAPLANGEWRKSYELYQNRVAPELLRLPGVREVAAVNAVPMSLGSTEHIRFATRFGIEGMSFDPGRYPTAQLRWCTPGYFHVLGIPLLSGRLLTEEDHGKERYVINQALADRFFPHMNPAGKKLWMNVVTPHPEAAEIVGVVGDVREFGLSSDPEPAMYQVEVSNEMEIVVKTAEATAVPALEGLIAATMRRVNPAEAIGQVIPLDRYVGASLARQRFLLWLIAALAAMAVLLCIVGLYGVFSYSVTRRMREFGIRSAVGAQRRHLLNQVMAEGALVILSGLAAGLALSAGCSKFIGTLLYRVSPTDSVSMVWAASGVLAAGLGSVIIPALRAMRADPAIVLREQ